MVPALLPLLRLLLVLTLLRHRLSPVLSHAPNVARCLPVSLLLVTLLLALPGLAHAVAAPGSWGASVINSATSGSRGTLTLTPPTTGLWTTGAAGGFTISNTVTGGSAIGMGRATLNTSRAIVTVPARYTLTTTAGALSRTAVTIARGGVPGVLMTAVIGALLSEAKLRWTGTQWEREVPAEGNPDYCWTFTDCTKGFPTGLETCQVQYGAGYRSYRFSLSTVANAGICYGARLTDGYEIQLGGPNYLKRQTSLPATRWVVTDEPTATSLVQQRVTSDPARLFRDLVTNAPTATIQAEGRMETDARTRTVLDPNGRPTSVRLENRPDGITADDLPEVVTDSDALPPDTNTDPNKPTGNNPPGCGLPTTPPCKIDETGTKDGKAERDKAEADVKKTIDDIAAKVTELTVPKPPQPLVVPMPGFPTAACEPIKMGAWSIDWCWIVPTIHACFDAFWCIAAFFGCLSLIRENFTASV